jgi:hypothetical protein
MYMETSRARILISRLSLQTSTSGAISADQEAFIDKLLEQYAMPWEGEGLIATLVCYGRWR